MNLLDEGTRCPSSAVRGKCYCLEHHPRLQAEQVTPKVEQPEVPSAQTYRRAALELLGAETEQETVQALMMLFAMTDMKTTSADKLAAHLGINRTQAREIARRFKKNNIWKGNKLVVDVDVDMDNGVQVNVMFLLYALCGSGKVVRTN